MSIENHPNIHTIGLMMDILEAIEERIRGPHKEYLLENKLLIELAREATELIEDEIDHFLEIKDKLENNLGEEK